MLNTGGWTNIIEVSAGMNHTVGLRSDGTVVAVGDNSYGQINVQNWRNVVSISAKGNITVAMTADGKVLVTGHLFRYGYPSVAAWNG